jgi:hypothetical protein
MLAGTMSRPGGDVESKSLDTGRLFDEVDDVPELPGQSPQ